MGRLLCAAISAPASQLHPLAATVPQPPLDQQQSTTPSNVHTFMGKILNQNDVRFILRDGETDAWYHLDDQAKAEQFFAKDVVITGTYDGLSGTIRIQTIRERTASDQPPAPIAPSPDQENEPARNSAPPAAKPDIAASAPARVNPPQAPAAAVPRHAAGTSPWSRSAPHSSERTSSRHPTRPANCASSF